MTITGAPSDAIQDILEAVSDTLALRDQVPASQLHLRRRVSRDLDAFTRVLHSYGYYGAAIAAEVDEDARPLKVNFQIEPGEPYLISTVSIEPTVRPEDVDPFPDPLSLGLKAGAPLRARAVLDAEARLLQHIREGGHPFPEVLDRDIVIDHATQQAEVTFFVDPGIRRRFGPATVSGLSDVHESFVHASLPWEEGEWYKESLIRETQRELRRSRLFSLVRTEAQEGEGDLAPIAIQVVERPHRTISAGLRYHTDTGFDAIASWQHRNIGGLGRRLSVDLGVGETEQGVGVGFRVPHFRRRYQSLSFEAEVRRRDVDAYTSRRFGGRAEVERVLTDPLTVRAGVAYRFDRVEQARKSERYHLLSLPASVRWDDTDDPLNPSRGTRLSLGAEPFVDVSDMGTYFLKTECGVSRYIALSAADGLVLALRAKLGMLAGASRDGIPPDERFYAGGGASVRGYPYKTISSLDGKTPLGGRSLFESSVELRKMVTETIGLVVFVDGGTATKHVFPRFGSDFRLGAGLGGRYLSPIGPLRLDVAVPLNPRPEIDSSFEIYMSLGQAF